MIRQLRTDRLKLTPNEFDALVQFVALMYVRTPMAWNRVRDWSAAFAWALLDETWKDRETFDRNMARAAADGVKVGGLTFEEARRLVETRPLRVEPVPNALILAMINGWRELYQSFQRRAWSLHYTTGRGGLFIASDDPASYFLNERGDYSGVFRCDPRDPRAIVTLPLPPHLLLSGAHGARPRIYDATLSEVAAFNAMTVGVDATVAYAETSSFKWLDPRTHEVRDCSELPDFLSTLRSDLERFQQKDQDDARERVEQMLGQQETHASTL